MSRRGLFLFLIIVTLILSGCTVFEGKEEIIIGITQWVSNQEYTANIQGFKDGLAENGYIEGENIHFIIDNPEADEDRQREIIQSFIDEDVDLIYSLTTPGTLIAKEMVKDKPIVFSIVTFPVEVNIISDLRNSGNNLVGTRNYVPMAKQYYQFERIFPEVKSVAVVHRKGEPNSAIQYNEFKELLSNRGIEIVDIAAVNLDDMRAQLESKIEDIDVMFSACDTLIQSGGEEVVIDFSRVYKKPCFSCNKDGVFKGALMGTVTDFYTLGKISGEKAAEILNGAQPSWLITESPRADYIVINKKTADELGIVIKQEILDDAVEVIE